jgi:hypothetical protein
MMARYVIGAIFATTGCLIFGAMAHEYPGKAAITLAAVVAWEHGRPAYRRWRSRRGAIRVWRR